MKLASIVIYPVKGCAGTALAETSIDAPGCESDRRYALVRPSGVAYTQRDNANLARVQAQVLADGLVLGFDGATIGAPAAVFESSRMQARVWSRFAEVAVATESVNATLSDWLGEPLALVRLERPTERKGATLALGDAAALLVTNAASLDDLNGRLVSPVPMDRFRPNLVVTDAKAFAEDQWVTLRVGKAVLRLVHPCGRCEVPTIDQEFGVALGDEPIRTLASYRMRNGEAVFGVRFSVQTPGRVRVGDAVAAGT